jgi:hypothetical protein
MNKIVILFFGLFIAASCSELKYKHAVKRTLVSYHTSNKSEKEIENDSKLNAKQVPVAETSIAQNTSDETAVQPLELDENTTLVNHTSSELTTENQPISVLAVKTKVFENEEDSTKSVSPQKIKEALDAENLGVKSRNLGIAGFIFQFTFIFGFVGLILSIIGLMKGIKSLRADYNTPKGVTNAKIGVVFSSITLGFYALILLLLVIFILAFVL